MALKLDNLWKHGDKRKVSFVILRGCTTKEYLEDPAHLPQKNCMLVLS